MFRLPLVLTGAALTAAAACIESPAVFVPGNEIVNPVLVSSVRPQYTSEALTARVEGKVMLSCVVRADGTVGDVSVIRSLDLERGLDAQAVQAVRQWTFRPGTRRGVPVAVRVAVELTFTLQ